MLLSRLNLTMKSSPLISLLLVLGPLNTAIISICAGQASGTGYSYVTLVDYEHLKYALETAARNPKKVGDRCAYHLGTGLLTLMKKYGGMSAQEMMNVDNSEIAARDLELLEIELLKEARRFTAATRKTTATQATTINTTATTPNVTTTTATTTVSTSNATNASSTTTNQTLSTTTPMPTTTIASAESKKTRIDANLIRSLTQHVYDMAAEFCPITGPLVCAGNRCRECKWLLPKEQQLVAFCNEAETLGKRFGGGNTASHSQQSIMFMTYLSVYFIVVVLQNYYSLNYEN